MSTVSSAPTDIETETLEAAVKARHWLHRHPEMALREFDTTHFIKDQLASYGIEVNDVKEHSNDENSHNATLTTGLTADIHGTKGDGPTLALRADIDGLPVVEDSNHAFASLNPGMMHACGHDLHMASLLGAARELQLHRNHFRGTVRLLFQPAEEAELGAQKVLSAGWLNGVDVIVGYHNHPGLPVGTLGISAKPIMGGNYRFDVSIHGRGAHGSRPEDSADPIAAFTAMSSEIQTIISRNMPPLDPAVVSITQVRAGQAWNIIPSDLEFHGTARAFNRHTAELIQERLTRIVHGVSEAQGVTSHLDWSVRAVPIENDPDIAATLARSAEQYALHVIEPVPSLGSDDFADFQHSGIPGVFSFIGSNGSAEAAGWHTPDFEAKDAALPYAIDYYTHAVYDLLD
ncbi:MAG: amidohydrolase [Bifidobacterium sp.]|jgi:amidohydrolase|nr:amidohydrolase [Bifidobacterium sp.]MCH4175802.1 amidohydrolase [Bifidobacterium sp.]